MPGVSIEFVLVLGYAVGLAVIALLLEVAARHTHRRSVGMRTSGFTYHPDRDIWQCPEDQHLFPVFSDVSRGLVIYRAPASICNACRSKPACTDSDRGREIEHRTKFGLEYGMQRFHRVISIVLLVLACLLLLIECFRTSGLYSRLTLLVVLIAFISSAWRLAMELAGGQSTEQTASVSPEMKHGNISSGRSNSRISS